ncbi:hypothetical protein GCM10010294_25160 [Streptomyces griseoloalbus]|uniref:hypothetical protein n=1 Tax=Streptomyces griseoloalbus TaxID=67303 RepID=UPI0018762285|nr:hypothetical protein GCM10010294_25160 [Streptomyces griseoloalbus]
MSEQQTDPALTPAYTPSEEPDLTPRPSTVMAEPATPAACQQDYADAPDIRRRLGWKDGS